MCIRDSLRIVDTVMESSTVLMVNKDSWGDARKRQDIEDLLTLLLGALDARGRVLMKMNVARCRLEAVLEVLPSMKTPTIAQLSGEKSDYLSLIHI